MPIIDPSEVEFNEGLPVGVGFSAPVEEEVGFGDILGPMFRTENTIGAIFANQTEFATPTRQEMVDYANGEWNWEDQANTTEFTEDQDALDYLSLSKNQIDFDASVTNLRRIEEDRDTISKAGLGAQLSAGIIAGTLDPIQFPLMAIPALKSATLAKTMAGVGAGGLASSLIAEGSLQSLDPLRTGEQSAINIGLGTAFGITLGGVAYGIGRAMGVSVIKPEELTPEIQAAIDEHLGAPMDAGAAAVIDPNFNNPKFVKELNEKVEKGLITPEEAAVTLRAHQLEWTGTKFPRVTRALARISPYVRVATSPFTSARIINEKLAEGTLVTGRNAEGFSVGPAVETIISGKRDVALANTYDIVGSAWRDHVDTNGKMFATFRGNRKAKGNPDMLTLEDFSTQIGRAIVDGGVHDNPVISATATKIRDEIMIPFEKELLDAKLIGKDEFFIKGTDEKVRQVIDKETGLYKYVKEDADADGNLVGVDLSELDIRRTAKVPTGDTWFLPRMWNFDRLKSNQTEFSDIMMKEVEKGIRNKHNLDAVAIKEAVEARIIADLEKRGKKNKQATIDKKVKAEVKRILEEEIKDELSQIRDGMGEFIRNIIGTPTGFIPKDMAFKGSHLLKRTLNISTPAIQDFLIQDIRYVLHGYLDSMIPRVELAKKFDGDFSMKEEFIKINEEYEGLVRNMPDGKEKSKLTKEKENVIRDLLGMRDILLRNYKRPDDPSGIFNMSGKRLREWNYVTKLGGMTVAAIPDVGNVVMRSGFKRLAKQLMVALPNPKSFINRAQAKQVGASLDYQLQGRAESMLMIDDNYGHVSKLDTGINKTVRQFGNLTGMTYWNTFWKGVASGAFMDEVGAIITPSGMSKSTKAWLAEHKIPKDSLADIKSQWKKYGTVEEGLRVPNTDKWTNARAKEILEAAILKEANTSIVTPGAGDLPLVSRHAVGKMWLQFSTFPMSATTRLLTPMIQTFDAQKAAGAVTMVMLGMFSYSIKELAAGRTPSTDIGTLVREGVDRSGVFGMWGNVNAITEKLSAGRVGLQPLLGGEQISKYRARSVINDLMGPSMGTLKDTIKITNAIFDALADGEISPSDINAVRRLLPYQNLIFTRRLFDEVARVIGEEVE